MPTEVLIRLRPACCRYHILGYFSKVRDDRFAVLTAPPFDEPELLQLPAAVRLQPRLYPHPASTLEPARRRFLTPGIATRTGEELDGGVQPGVHPDAAAVPAQGLRPLPHLLLLRAEQERGQVRHTGAPVIRPGPRKIVFHLLMTLKINLVESESETLLVVASV